MRHVRFGLLLVVLLPFLAASVGCASWRGARLYQTGTVALDRGDVEVAVADLERAAALVPEASEVQNHLGLAYSAAGRRADAVAVFERAVALDCENRAAQQNLVAARQALSQGEPPGP